MGRLPTRSAAENSTESGLTRQVAVCPHCEQPVKVSGWGIAWLILVIPYVVAVLTDVLGILRGPIPGIVLIALIVLAAVGVILASITTKLEKRRAS